MTVGMCFFAPTSSNPTYRSQLAFEGTNGSTTFTDTGTGPPVWTAHGGAIIDTSQFAVGSSSGKFNGTNSYITTPDTANLRFGTSDFDIRFRIRFASLSGFQTIASKGYTTSSSGGWLIQTGNGDGKLVFYRLIPSATSVMADTGSTVSANTWYQIRIYRAGSSMYIERDGVQVGSGSASAFDYNSTAELSIGGGSSTGYNNFWFNGWMDQEEMT